MITHSEWMEAIHKALTRASDEGLTTRELASQMNVSIRTALERLRKLKDQGTIVNGWRDTISIHGLRSRTPVYRINKEEKRT